MTRLLATLLILLAAFAVPVEAQAPVWAVTATMDDQTEWIMVVTRNGTEMVRLEVRKLPGGAEKEAARDIAKFILRRIGPDIGTDLRLQLTEQIEAGIK